MDPLISDELLKALSSCAINPNVKPEDINSVFEKILNACSLDVVFVMTNKEYKYQLRYVLNCKRPGTLIKDHDEISMTLSEYDMLLNYYREHRFYVRPLTKEIHGTDGSMLQCAIMRDDEYYGTVGFGRAGKPEWSPEEKDLLLNVCQMMLLFIGLNRLKERRNRLETEMTNQMKENTLELFHVDLCTGRCHALRLADDMRKWCDEWGQYETLFQAHIHTYVNRAYALQLEKTLNLNNLKENLSIQNPTITLDYPIEFKGRFRWIRAAAELIESEEGNAPRTALLYFIDITEEEKDIFYLKHAANINQKHYAVIAGIDPETKQYAIYVNNTESLNPVHMIGNYEELLSRLINEVVDPLYIERFRHLFEIERLKAHFTVETEALKFDFPYHEDGKTIWIRLEAAAGDDGSQHEHMILLYFSDITEQKKREKEFQEISLSLEKERERVLQAELRAMIDPLTGAYNRAGFEHSVEQYQHEDVPIGFLLLDVDHFKAINDTYGHDFGDEVLSLIARSLLNSFRDEDKVFRLGGDEFALLLPGCHADACHSLQLKFLTIHQYLRKSLLKDITVTLSAGFTQSDHGYTEGMYKLADEALYHTKSTGRAGLSQINSDHKITFAWHDLKLIDRRNSKSKGIALGNWRLELSNESLNDGKLFLDETAHLMFEFPDTLTPEECYQCWRKRLVERHFELCAETVEQVRTTGQAECTYHWNHPTKGELAYRTACKGMNHGSITEISGYTRELNPSDIVLSCDDDQFIMNALNRSCFSTYYFNLATREYYIVKGHQHDPNVKARHYNIDASIKNFISKFVHPDFRQRVMDFTDLTTLPQRLKGIDSITCEFLSITPLGWCQTQIIPAKWNENGEITHAMVMNFSIDDAKKAELEKEETTRQAIALQLRVGELVSKTSIIQTGIIDKDTGLTKIWTDAIFTNPCILRKFEEMTTWGRRGVYEPDRVIYDAFFSLPHIINELEHNPTFEFSHRFHVPGSDLRTIVYHFETLKTDISKILMVIEDVTKIMPTGIEWMNQFEILEGVKEMIALFDYDTYDIVYLNRMAREKIGMEMTELKKKKCYELFGDTGEPCPFCDNFILEDGNNAFMLKDVKGLNQTFFLHGCILMINGKKYRMEQAVPASDLQSGFDQILEKIKDADSSDQK